MPRPTGIGPKALVLEVMAISSFTDPPNRKKSSMENKNYSFNGAYFITICTKDRHEIFGKIDNGVMLPSEVGRIAVEMIQRMETVYESVVLDAFVLMPNHVHMLILLLHERKNPTIQRIIQQYKGVVTKKAGFSLWQYRYHDHVVYDAAEFRRIREYIRDNPRRWENDYHYAKGPLAQSR